jgi:hypothetical protein
MAKISYENAIKRLVEFYTDTEGMLDPNAYLWQHYNAFREEADRRSPAPIDWDFYLRYPTTDKNIAAHTQQVLNLFFHLHDYDYVLDCYKDAKRAAKTVA